MASKANGKPHGTVQSGVQTRAIYIVANAVERPMQHCIRKDVAAGRSLVHVGGLILPEKPGENRIDSAMSPLGTMNSVSLSL